VRHKVTLAWAFVGAVEVVGVLAGYVTRVGEPGVSVRALHTTNDFVADVLVDGQRGRVFVLDVSGGGLGADRVSILDTRSGQLLRTIGVGLRPAG